MTTRAEADVVVVGAGAAGLMAALRLAERSLRVVLLEARERVGGRVWTRPVPRSATPAELGAEFIHGRARQTMDLLRAAGTTAVRTGGADEFLSPVRLFERARELSSDESVDRFLNRFEEEEATRAPAQEARAFVEGFEAADPAIASVRGIAHEWGSGVDLTSARPRGGYAPIVERLRRDGEAAGVELRTSTIARRISWRRGAVSVDAEDRAGEPATIRARAGIVTLPAGVLRHAGDDGAVEFDPDLPSGKREALGFIEMGHAVKVVLWYRTAFWERVAGGRHRDAAFFRPKGKAFPAYWTQFPVRSTLIVAWAGGPPAVALERLTPAKLVERARHGFGSLLREPALARKEFAGAATHDWTRDPFARGAYSYLAVGGDDARAALAAPVDDTLFFAGEATSTDGQSGTVNGAFDTGERAAAQTAGSLGAA